VSIESLGRGKPIYFLINIEGLTIFDIRFSAFAPKTDGVIIGGLVSAISTFSDNMMDNISSESGTLNVIEREGMKIMFERGQRVEAILVVDVESQILMEKIRVIIDLFEHNYLEKINKILSVAAYTPFRNLTREFFKTYVDENIVFKSVESSSKDDDIKIPSKFSRLLETFDGKMSVIDISRKINWPLPYIITRSAALQQLGKIKSIDISIKKTDIFQLEDSHIGILLEQGSAYQTINKHWGDWGVKIIQKIDGKHTINSLSKKLVLSHKEELRLNQLFRFLSLRGYIKPLSDYKLLLIIFSEFLNDLRSHLSDIFGSLVAFEIFEAIFQQDMSYSNDKGRIICVSKLIENYPTGFHFEKLDTVMRSRSQIVTPLFQHAFFPFMDHIIRNLTKFLGRKITMDLLKVVIVEIEQYYGRVVYDVLFSSEG
jgi:hypothetical protein